MRKYARDLTVTRMKRGHQGWLKDEGRFAQNKVHEMVLDWVAAYDWSLLFHFHPLLTQVHLCVLVSQFSLESSIGERGRRAHSQNVLAGQGLRSCPILPLLILPIKGLRLNRGINLSKVSDWLVSGPGQEARFSTPGLCSFHYMRTFQAISVYLFIFVLSSRIPVLSK